MLYKSISDDINISQIGFGCASFWANKLFDEKKATAIVQHAYDLGINYFDTGRSYGNGMAEARLSKAVIGIPREKIVISTKIGSYPDAQKRMVLSFDINFLKDQLDQSLKALKTDYIDVLYFHGPNNEDINDDLKVFAEYAKKSGKIKLIGLNSFTNEVILNMHNMNFLDVYMLDYNIVNYKKNSIIQIIDKPIIAAAPLASNYIDPKFFKLNSLSSVWYILRALIKKRKEFINARNMQHIFKKFAHISPQAIALNFALNHPKISGVVIGTTNEKHLLDNIKSCNIVIPNDLNEIFKELQNEI